MENTATNGLTFQSINDTGGAEGIYLKGTGSGASLNRDRRCQHDAQRHRRHDQQRHGIDGAAAGNAVYLDDTDGVSLEQMTLTGSDNNGISVSNAAGFAFQHGSLSNNGTNEAGPYRESNVKITGSTGALTLSDVALSTPQENNVYLTLTPGRRRSPSTTPRSRWTRRGPASRATACSLTAATPAR